MSRAWRSRRAALFAGAAAAGAPAAGSAAPDARSTRRRGGDAELVGRDFARSRARADGDGRATWVPALVACVVAALLLAALRVQVLRVRYELGRAVAEETRLLERQRAATVALGELRDPRRLRRLAAERGFVRPERVIELSSDASAGRP
ncbi:MAG: hypothetical protein R3263_00195 [Myxococcota bacterium]|nr:hypothetical protein [Myxococcota bacterium]